MSQTFLIPEFDATPHDEWGMLMSLALDDLLDGEDQQRLKRHLAGCEPCQQQWQIWQRIDDTFQAAPLVMPATGFAQRVEARIDSMEAVRKRRVAWALTIFTLFVWIAGFVGTGLLLGLLVYNGIGWFAESWQWLQQVWQVTSIFTASLWNVVIGLSQNPATVNWMLCYMGLALAMLTGWGYLLRRSLRPFEVGVA